MSRDFELGPNLSGLSKIAYLFIASGNLGMFERQMGMASVGVNAGAVDGFSHVNARPQTISKRDMLISVLSYVSVDGFLSRRNIRSRPSVPVRD